MLIVYLLRNLPHLSCIINKDQKEKLLGSFKYLENPKTVLVWSNYKKDDIGIELNTVGDLIL